MCVIEISKCNSQSHVFGNKHCKMKSILGIWELNILLFSLQLFFPYEVLRIFKISFALLMNVSPYLRSTSVVAIHVALFSTVFEIKIMYVFWQQVKFTLPLIFPQFLSVMLLMKYYWSLSLPLQFLTRRFWGSTKRLLTIWLYISQKKKNEWRILNANNVRVY